MWTRVEDIRHWHYEPGIPKCELENGDICVWDDARQVWVNTVTGARYTEGDGEEYIFLSPGNKCRLQVQKF
jgi:hypothetical protein